jgi:hypothetical protein
MQLKRRMGWTRAGGAATLLAVLAVAVPVSGANAQTPVVPPLSTLPAAPFLPPASAAAAGAAVADLPAVLPVVPTPVAGRYAQAGASIGNVFNGGLSVIVSNGSPLHSGNVIASP